MENFYQDVNKDTHLLNLMKETYKVLHLRLFFSAVSVYNIGTDLVACSNAIEPRNLFIQKKILEI